MNISFHIVRERHKCPTRSDKKTYDARAAIEEEIKRYTLYEKHAEIAPWRFPIKCHPRKNGDKLTLFAQEIEVK